jgi:hypothetical protein
MDANLQRPTPELVNHYVSQFEEDRYTSAADEALSLLYAAYPENACLAEVLLKVAALNSLYSTNIYAITAVAQRIVDLQIDARLREPDLSLVEEIALVEVGGKKRRNYSFATKYCSWHEPEMYPIYDWYSERLLWAYQEKWRFSEGRRKEWQNSYPSYACAHAAFRRHFGLEEYSAKQVDKFLWRYAKELFG